MTNLRTNVATKCESGEVASVDTVLVQMANVELYRGVVLRSDQPIGCRAAMHHKFRTLWSHFYCTEPEINPKGSKFESSLLFNKKDPK